MKKLIIFGLSLSLVFMSNAVLAKKKLYKWVDENGNVSYSDQVPPDRISKKHEELNDHAVVIDKIGNARTKEEIKAEREARLKAKKEKEIAETKEKERQNILKSYTSESELIRLKDERVSALNRNIERANQNLVFQKTSREQLLSRAADDERNGKEISKALKSRIKIIEDKIKYQAEYIKAKEKEIKRVEAKFVKDLGIYRDAMHAGK